jgi:hypothetical protein
MTEHDDIQALEQWLAGFPDPQPSAECIARVRSAVSAALAEARPMDAVLPVESRDRLRRAVHLELRLHRAARLRRRVVVWSGAAAAAAAIVMLALWAGRPTPGVSVDGLGEIAVNEEEIEGIEGDPETAGLAAQLADLEVRTAALDLLVQDDYAGDWQTLSILEGLAAPDFGVDSEDFSL